jgi:hypothetical protein
MVVAQDAKQHGACLHEVFVKQKQNYAPHYTTELRCEAAPCIGHGAPILAGNHGVDHAHCRAATHGLARWQHGRSRRRLLCVVLLGGPASMAAGVACTRAMRFPRRGSASGIRGTGGPSHDVATLCTRNIGEVGARCTEAPGERSSVCQPMGTRCTSGGAAARNGAGGRKRPAETPCGAHRELVSRQSPRTSATERERERGVFIRINS